jgi:hypothetical protein
MKTLLSLIALVLLGLASHAQTIQNVAGFPITASNATVTVGTTLTIPMNKAAALYVTYSCGAGTSNLVLNFDQSYDGVNFTTSLPITASAAVATSSTNTALYTLTAAQLANGTALKLTSVSTTQTNNVVVTKVVAFSP